MLERQFPPLIFKVHQEPITDSKTSMLIAANHETSMLIAAIKGVTQFTQEYPEKIKQIREAVALIIRLIIAPNIVTFRTELFDYLPEEKPAKKPVKRQVSRRSLFSPRSKKGKASDSPTNVFSFIAQNMKRLLNKENGFNLSDVSGVIEFYARRFIRTSAINYFFRETKTYESDDELLIDEERYKIEKQKLSSDRELVLNPEFFVGERSWIMGILYDLVKELNSQIDEHKEEKASPFSLLQATKSAFELMELREKVKVIQGKIKSQLITVAAELKTDDGALGAVNRNIACAKKLAEEIGTKLKELLPEEALDEKAETKDEEHDGPRDSRFVEDLKKLRERFIDENTELDELTQQQADLSSELKAIRDELHSRKLMAVVDLGKPIKLDAEVIGEEEKILKEIKQQDAQVEECSRRQIDLRAEINALDGKVREINESLGQIRTQIADLERAELARRQEEPEQEPEERDKGDREGGEAVAVGAVELPVVESKAGAEEAATGSEEDQDSPEEVAKKAIGKIRKALINYLTRFGFSSDQCKDAKDSQDIKSHKYSAFFVDKQDKIKIVTGWLSTLSSHEGKSSITILRDFVDVFLKSSKALEQKAREEKEAQGSIEVDPESSKGGAQEKLALSAKAKMVSEHRNPFKRLINAIYEIINKIPWVKNKISCHVSEGAKLCEKIQGIIPKAEPVVPAPPSPTSSS